MLCIIFIFKNVIAKTSSSSLSFKNKTKKKSPGRSPISEDFVMYYGDTVRTNQGQVVQQKGGDPIIANGFLVATKLAAGRLRSSCETL